MGTRTCSADAVLPPSRPVRPPSFRPSPVGASLPCLPLPASTDRRTRPVPTLPRRPTRWGAGPPPFTGQQQQQQQQQGGAAALQASSNGISNSNSGPASSHFRSQSPLNPAAGSSASSAAASTPKAQMGMPNSSSETAAGAGGPAAFPAVQAGPADIARMHDKMLVSGLQCVAHDARFWMKH